MSYTMQAKNGYKWWWVFNYLLSFLLLLLYLFLELLTFLCLENDKTFWQPMQTSFLSISFRFLLSCLVNYKKKQGDTKNNNFICAFFQLYRHELMKSVKGPFTIGCPNVSKVWKCIFLVLFPIPCAKFIRKMLKIAILRHVLRSRIPSEVYCSTI